MSNETTKAADGGEGTLKRKHEEEDDDEGEELPISKDLSMDIHLKIVGYLDHDSLDEFGCVSTKCREIHSHSSLAHLRTAVLSVRWGPTPYQRLLLKLQEMQNAGIFGRYKRLKILERLFFEDRRTFSIEQIEQLQGAAVLADIKALDIGRTDSDCCVFLTEIAKCMTNLREIVLTGVTVGHGNLCGFWKLQHLEKITWYRQKYTTIQLSGADFVGGKKLFPSLKELHFDDSELLVLDNEILEENGARSMFHAINDKLECLSIRNLKCFHGRVDPFLVPQHVLVNFVRKSPKLRWLRSDLTPENVAMLQLERPDVIFCS